MRIILSVLLFVFVAVQAAAQFPRITLPGRGGSGNTPVSNTDAIAGLKEALNTGIGNAVANIGKVNGYLANPRIRIPLPPEAETVVSTVRRMGGPLGNRMVDSVITKMNRAAEDAAANPETRKIFVDAVKNLTIQDGLTILRGDTVAATRYLQGQTSTPLTNLYSPVIRKSMEKAGVQQAWGDVTKIYNDATRFFPGTKPVNTDLSQYITGKALEGMFFVIGQEETKIRKNPAARITDLLRRVFR
jgi:hypothetical protein